MTHHITVAFQHPANAGILTRLRKSTSGTVLPNGAPEEHPDPYFRLGTHPDLVARLWDEITISLPTRCQWIINNSPVLVHPASGIIFGYAGGTHTYALRLPSAVRQEALEQGAKRVHVYPGSTFDLDTVGEEWVLGWWFQDEARWCRAAYKFAGSKGKE